MHLSLDRQCTTKSSLLIVRRLSAALIIIGAVAFALSAITEAAHSAADDVAVTDRHNHRIQVSGPKASSAPTRLAAAPLASIVVDRTDDDPLAAACTGAANDCSLRGAVSFANANPGTSINVPAGTYMLTIPGGLAEGFAGDNSVGDLDVTGNNTAIIGVGAGSTTIQQTQAGDRVIEVNPFLEAGFNFSISNVTITGGTETTGVGGGGIISGSIDNTVNVTGCVISGNSATGAGSFGGGGISHTGGSLTITDSTFSNNSTSSSGGGVGYSAGDPLGRQPSVGSLTVTGSTFSSNSANSAAAGGGAMDLFDFNSSTGSYSISSSSFSGNQAMNGNGGAIIVESGPLSVTTSSLSTNTAGNRGGAIYSSGNTTVAFSRLVGNTVSNPINGLTLFRASGSSITAEDNWWGRNSGPGVNDFRDSSSTLSPRTWLQLRHSASPSEICADGISTLTADIRQRNEGDDLTNELNGLPEFPASFVNSTPALGAVTSPTNFINGEATATFTATSGPGTAMVDVVADSETVTASISIVTTSTTDPTDQTVCAGATVNFSTTASGVGPFTYEWKLDGNEISGATNSSVNIDTTGFTAGDHLVEVTVTGECGVATQVATLTVQTAPVVTVHPQSQTIDSGNVTFTSMADGSPAPSVQWQVSTDGGANFVDIPGAMSTTLMFAADPSQNGNQYRAVFTNDCGMATSNAATLTTCLAPVVTVGTENVVVWPPNHNYLSFNVTDFIASATSNCDGDLLDSVVIASVSSDEAENGPGADGNTVDDIVIAENCKSVQLRAERDGNLNGRVYTITFKVTDSAGNTTTVTATVSVPKDQNGAVAVNDGPAGGYTVTSGCP